IYNKDGNKLDLYGKVDGLHYFSDNDSKDGDKTYMRLGFKGETQVTDQLTGYGQWEYQIQGNEPESDNSSWTRVAFAGLKFQDVGSFDYGRNYGVVYDVTSWTDVLPEFGGDTYDSDNFMQQRGNGFATYRNTDFFGLVDGLDFAVQYQGKNGSAHGEGMTTNGRNDVFEQNGDGVGGSITYNYEGFGIGAAVSSSKRTDAQNNTADYIGTGDRAETYTGGLKYDANNIY
ncbi:porin, partial [Escherichia coli]